MNQSSGLEATFGTGLTIRLNLNGKNTKNVNPGRNRQAIAIGLKVVTIVWGTSIVLLTMVVEPDAQLPIALTFSPLFAVGVGLEWCLFTLASLVRTSSRSSFSQHWASEFCWVQFCIVRRVFLQYQGII